VAFSNIWHPEQSGPFMQRMFADRRDQTRQILSATREVTGSIQISALLAAEQKEQKQSARPPVPTPMATPVASDRRAPVPTPMARPVAAERDSVATVPKAVVPLTSPPPRKTGVRTQVEPVRAPPPVPTPAPIPAARKRGDHETTGEHTIAVDLDELVRAAGEY